MNHYHVFETRLGFAGIAWNNAGIVRFRLPDRDRAAAEKQFGKAEPGTPPPAIAAVIAQAVRYFAGERIDFSPIDLDLGAVDPFRRAGSVTATPPPTAIATARPCASTIRASRPGTSSGPSRSDRPTCR